MSCLRTLLSVLALTLGIPLLGQAGIYGVLTYEISNNEVTITGCNNGNEGPAGIPTPIAHLEIPVTIEGVPVTTVGAEVFHYCAIESISIPAGVTNVPEGAFAFINGLTNFAVDPNNSALSTIDNVLFNKDRSVLIAYPERKQGEQYVIPEGVRIIGFGGLAATSYLNSISIPNSVTNIGAEAFHASRFFEFNIPNSVTSIGEKAFSHIWNLTNITIGSGVTSIGDLAFNGCSYLLSISVNESNLSYISLDGILFTKDRTLLIQYPANNPSGIYTIPDSVICIGNSAFEGCNLTSITIPGSVTSIGESAFSQCLNLTSVTIGSGVTNIGNRAFYLNWGISNVTFHGAPPEVGEFAFPNTHFKARAGFGSTLNGKTVTQEMRVKSTSMDSSNNLRIETDALNTTGLKVFHTTSLSSSFTEVTGITKEGEGRVIIPSGNSARQGSSGFYKVVYEN
jgi:hypothetical protein